MAALDLTRAAWRKSTRSSGNGNCVEVAILDREIAEVAARRAELQEEAFAYGERLFAEKPKRFVKRMESYWVAAEL